MKAALLSDEAHGNSRSVFLALKVISWLNVFTDPGRAKLISQRIGWVFVFERKC